MSHINPNPFTTRPEIEGMFGVADLDPLDPATAVRHGHPGKGRQLTRCDRRRRDRLHRLHPVVEPHLNGPGGDVPIIVHDVKRGATQVICGQGPAPAGATIAHYKSEGLEMVPGTGLLAACIPGTFESWMLLLRDYGTMRLRDVLEPAIAYARDGYPFLERAAATVKTVEQLFRKYWTTSAAVYLPNNEVPKPGSIFTNAKLAETYTRILKEAESAGGNREAQIEAARKAWSKGFVAEAIDKFCRTQEVMDVSGSPHRGVLSADDMVRWQPTIEAPLTYDYGRYTVCKAGVWSQGPVMLQQLALLKGFQLDGLDPTGPEFIHTQIECAKLAYADREKFYGDPKFTEIPIATLLSDAYNDERRKLISDKASLDFVPGSVEGFGGVVKLRRQEGSREAVGAMGAGEPTVGRFGEVNGDTVHFDIIDQAGNMISATPSGGWLQSSPVIPELGFCLGSRAQMFWLEEDHPGFARAGQTPTHHALADHGAARWRAVPVLGFARRRPAGSMDHAILPAARPCQDEFAGSDRCAGLAFRAFPDLVLAAHRASRRDGGREPCVQGDDREPARTRPHRRGRTGLVRRPPDRRLENRPPPPRRRQRPRHAGLRGRTLEHMTWSIIAKDNATGQIGIARRHEILCGRLARPSHCSLRIGGDRDAGAGQSLLRHRRR